MVTIAYSSRLTEAATRTQFIVPLTACALLSIPQFAPFHSLYLGVVTEPSP